MHETLKVASLSLLDGLRVNFKSFQNKNRYREQFISLDLEGFSGFEKKCLSCSINVHTHTQLGVLLKISTVFGDTEFLSQKIFTITFRQEHGATFKFSEEYGSASRKFSHHIDASARVASLRQKFTAKYHIRLHPTRLLPVILDYLLGRVSPTSSSPF